MAFCAGLKLFWKVEGLTKNLAYLNLYFVVNFENAADNYISLNL